MKWAVTTDKKWLFLVLSGKFSGIGEKNLAILKSAAVVSLCHL